MKFCSLFLAVCASVVTAQIGLIDTCFNLGTEAGSGTLIKDGHYLSNQTMVAETKFYALFIVWLSEACPDATHNFTVTATSSVPSDLTTKWSHKGSANKLSVPGVARGQLTLEWNCPVAPSEEDYVVGVTIETTHNQGAEVFQPITMQILKKCFPPIVPPADEPKGWTGGGIFVFVVFILTLLFCVFGCGFNYISRGRTGWEIVPGAVLCSALLGRCVKEPRYTPQMDYDAPVGEQGDHYGATYQADL